MVRRIPPDFSGGLYYLAPFKYTIRKYLSLRYKPKSFLFYYEYSLYSLK